MIVLSVLSTAWATLSCGLLCREKDASLGGDVSYTEAFHWLGLGYILQFGLSSLHQVFHLNLLCTPMRWLSKWLASQSRWRIWFHISCGQSTALDMKMFNRELLSATSFCNICGVLSPIPLYLWQRLKNQLAGDSIHFDAAVWPLEVWPGTLVWLALLCTSDVSARVIYKEYTAPASSLTIWCKFLRWEWFTVNHQVPVRHDELRGWGTDVCKGQCLNYM